jgi:hypothetical protein
MGYSDYLIWKQLTETGYKFVTRQKDNARFKIIEKRRCPEKDIIADHILYKTIQGFTPVKIIINI